MVKTPLVKLGKLYYDFADCENAAVIELIGCVKCRNNKYIFIPKHKMTTNYITTLVYVIKESGFVYQRGTNRYVWLTKGHILFGSEKVRQNKGLSLSRQFISNKKEKIKATN